MPFRDPTWAAMPASPDTRHSFASGHFSMHGERAWPAWDWRDPAKVPQTVINHAKTGRGGALRA